MSIEANELTSAKRQMVVELNNFMIAEIAELEDNSKIKIYEIECLNEMYDKLTSSNITLDEAKANIKNFVNENFSPLLEEAFKTGLTKEYVIVKRNQDGEIVVEEKLEQKQFYLTQWMLSRYAANLPRNVEEKRQWDAMRLR